MSHNFVNKVHTFFASAALPFSLLPLFSKGSTLKGKNSRWKVFIALGNKEEVTKVVSFEKETVMERHGGVLIRLNLFNPIALRKAKIVYNFGLSECNRVIALQLTLLHSERPKLYTILAFLSAIGLKLYS